MKSVRGFTLLEITVVISIIILLGTIFIANYRGGEKQFALRRSANKLAQDLRRTQEMAMSGVLFNGVFPKGGYGIHLKEDLDSYILFADCDGDGESDENGPALTCTDATPENPYPETIEEISLEEGIKILTLNPHTGSKALEITFFPPDPTVTINPDASSATISLTFDGVSQKTVTVNKVGLIDIE